MSADISAALDLRPTTGVLKVLSDDNRLLTALDPVRARILRAVLDGPCD